ncbi:MAG TPA: hypothetical protein VGH20_07280 [Myxococcales bacterium]|jgi:hypothetical protein
MRRLPLITLLAAASACQGYVAVPVTPVTLVAVEQRTTVRVATKADVLLVVDDSASMSGKQDRLAAALSTFTSQLDALEPPVDYQVAVTTTSVAERLGACGPAGDPNAAGQCDSDWQAAGFACDTKLACFRTFTEAGQFHQAGTAPAILPRASFTPQQFAQLLAGNVQVGTAGSRQPQGMEAMKVALTSTPGQQFLRDGAKVVVAFFTDAEDCSDPNHRLSMLTKDPATGNIVDRCAQETEPGFTGTPSLEPVANYVNFLRGLKNLDGSPKEVEIGAVVSLTDGTSDPGVCSNPSCDAQCDSQAQTDACNARCQDAPTFAICVSDCISTCHSFCGGQVPGRRYLELAFSFSGQVANVCSDDAGPALGQLSQVIGIPKQVNLRTAPSPSNLLVVRVHRGAQDILCNLGDGYDLVPTAQGQAVHFDGACVLQPNDTYDIRYLTAK